MGPSDLHVQAGSADIGASSAYTAQWLDTGPESAAEAQPALAPQSDHSNARATELDRADAVVPGEDIAPSQHGSAGHPRQESENSDIDGLREATANRLKGPDDAPAAARRMTELRRISLTAPEEDVCEGESLIRHTPPCPSCCHQRDPKASLLR